MQTTLYLVTALLALVIGFIKTKHFVITLSALTIPVQAFIINYLCEKGYPLVAWVLTLVPMVSLFVLIFYVERKHHKKEPKKPDHPVMHPPFPVDHSGMYNKETERRAHEKQ